MIKIRIVENGEGAVGATEEKPAQKKRATNVHRGQRKPKTIKVESFRNNDMKLGPADKKGLLPSGSRETTPLNDTNQQLVLDDKGFFSGNPFVEVTKGIIHMYKKK